MSNDNYDNYEGAIMPSRDLGEVIDSIFPLLENAQAEYDLSKVKDSYLFAAPEMAGFWWNRAEKALIKHAPLNHKNFLQIRKIWNNEK